MIVNFIFPCVHKGLAHCTAQDRPDDMVRDSHRILHLIYCNSLFRHFTVNVVN